MSTISNIGSYDSTSAGSAANRLPVRTLGQEDFLKLLVAQLTTQDPMSPQADTDFFSQMATFSSIEQTKAMQSDLAQLRSDQEVLKANSLLGRTVAVALDENTNATGLVSAVQIEAGTPKVIVGDMAFDLTDVVAISPSVIA